MSNIRLSKQEEKIINRLPEAVRAQATAEILAEKTRVMETASKARTEFKLVHQSSGTLSVFGLGRKFPISLYKGEWERLFANLEAIKAEVAKMK